MMLRLHGHALLPCWLAFLQIYTFTAKQVLNVISPLSLSRPKAKRQSPHLPACGHLGSLLKHCHSCSANAGSLARPAAAVVSHRARFMWYRWLRWSLCSKQAAGISTATSTVSADRMAVPVAWDPTRCTLTAGAKGSGLCRHPSTLQV